jgi:uncharacterized protein (DUF885 family)
MSSTPRGVHQLSDEFVADYAALDPNAATHLGITGYDEELTDYSPEGHESRAELTARALRAIEAAEPADESERAAKAVFLERNGLSREFHEAGLDLSSLNVIASPVQDLRQLFDLMPTETPEQWATVATRLTKVPQALAGLRASLSSARRGRARAAARRSSPG